MGPLLPHLCNGGEYFHKLKWHPLLQITAVGSDDDDVFNDDDDVDDNEEEAEGGQ